MGGGGGGEKLTDNGPVFEIWPTPCMYISGMFIMQWENSGIHLTTQSPSDGLGEPVAYGFQTLAKGAAL